MRRMEKQKCPDIAATTGDEPRAPDGPFVQELIYTHQASFKTHFAVLWMSGCSVQGQ